MRKTRVAVLAIAGLCVFGAQAATSRSSWVVSQIYNYNHPFAATDSTDLSTKMSTMSASAYNFYRGTDHIFYADMATLPASSYASNQTGYTWLGGDMHIGNFGAQRDSNGTAVFAVADFDEGYLGQFIWDLRRLATSMVLSGRASGISDSNITSAINTMISAYLAEMNDFKGNSDELSFQLKNSNTSGVVNDTIDSADGGSRSSLLAKYTQVSGNTRTFQNLSNLVAVDSGSYNAIKGGMTAYFNSISTSKQYAASYYTVKDIHQKLGSGVGSLGKLRYYILIEGPSSSTSDDVILEMKQETASAVATVDNGQLPASSYGNNEAGRVAKSNKACLLNADVLIGYTTVNGLEYYLHEKSPYQADFDPTQLTSSSKLNTAATFMGQALASAHAISDQDYDSSIVPYSIDKQVSDAVTSKSGFQSEISNFAFSYVDQVNLDWQSFVNAYNAGTALY